MLVYVLNKHGQPLMPCKPRKARILLRDKKASVVDVEPFTIQLIHGASGHKQTIVLGMDTIFEMGGISVISGNREIYKSEIELRTDISKKITKRRTFRKNRRNRKTRYRKPRFMNRSASTRKKKLPPSIQHKLDSHIRLINRVKKILPVTRTIIEKSKFDIARINNPDWEGKDFQKGPMYDYMNSKMYVRNRDRYKCRNCGNKKRKLQTHHIVPRSEGGSDRPDNLLTLCDVCHEGYHKGQVNLKIKKAPIQKQMTVMNILSKRLSELYEYTFGYLIKMKRLEQRLEKSHINDAFVIAGGTKDIERLDCTIIQKQVRRNNRKLFKGYRSEISNQCPKEIFGFRLFDKVIYEGKKYFIYGRRKKGSFLLKTLKGDITERIYKKLRKIKGRSSFLTEVQFLSGLKTQTPSEC